MDRLLLFRVARLHDFRTESQILDEIQENRDALCSEMINQLNAIVRALKNDKEPFKGKFRMADWAELGWRITRMIGQGDYFLGLLDKMDKAQTDFLIEDNSIYECLEVWLSQQDNIGHEVRASELFEEFKAIAESEGIGFGFKSSRSLGKQLRQMLSNLGMNFNITERQVNPACHYTFESKGK